MFPELEDAAMIKADAFKNAVAIKQSVVKHGHFGVTLAVILAIDKNLHAKSDAQYFKVTDYANVNLRDSVVAGVILARFL